MNQRKVFFGSIYSPPMGLIAEDIEDCYQNYYRPLLKVLYAHPHIPVVMFFSGILLKWMEKHHGEFLDVVAEMVQRRQLEMMGGGYYAPMLNLISRQDCIGQIELLTTYIRKRFGRRPRGCWVTEQIWEPSMPSILKSAGQDYVFLNEYHYWKAGFEERDFHIPCITEDQGKTLVVFPISNAVYQNFWEMTPESIQKQLLHSTQAADPAAATQATDPAADREEQIISLIHGFHHNHRDPKHIETHLTEVLSCLNELVNSNKIKVTLPSSYLRSSWKFPRGYFPATSYDEMQAYGSIIARENHPDGELSSGVGRAGYYYGRLFRQNLSRYNEVNLMYAKMQLVQNLTNQIRGDKYRKQAAKEELWQGQTNAPFWHGAHGGVYINNYRKEVYSALIRSEKLTREHGIFAPSIVSLDFDMDGLKELLYQGSHINAYIHLTGGILFELDYLSAPWNYLDTMGRYRETYHPPSDTAQGYDHYPRRGFIDHFLDPGVELKHFGQMMFEDRGDFPGAQYTSKYNIGTMQKNFHIPLLVEGSVRQPGGEEARIRIEKTYSFTRRTVHVDYCISNIGETDLSTIFSPEINLSFISPESRHLRSYAVINKSNKTEIAPTSLVLDSISGVLFQDLFNKVKIDVSVFPGTECWSLPLETRHLDRKKWKQTYQASTILPRWPLELKPGDIHKSAINISLSALR